MASKRKCTYIDSAGQKCWDICIARSNFCYWHDPDISKKGVNLSAKLEEWIAAGNSPEGIQAKYADLEDAHIGTGRHRVNLSNANFYRANLKHAHLFQTDLIGTNLMKADLTGANLNHANVTNANLLACIFDAAKVERVNWGKRVIQEEYAFKAKREGDLKAFYDNLIEAEEIYRNLHNVYEARGMFENSGHFFHKEMRMKRFQLPLWSKARFFSKLADVFAGYGEHPVKVVTFSISVILLCACFYFLEGVSGPNGMIQLDSNLSLIDNFYNFTNCLYFSIVTFTTLGYGDITPLGWIRTIAAIEAFTGSFTLALFVVVFVKKMTR